MIEKPVGEPLSGDVFKRVVEQFGQSLADAVSAARPGGDQAEFLRKLGAEVRVSAIAMEAESAETAKALHLTADKLNAAAMLEASAPDAGGRAQD